MPRKKTKPALSELESQVMAVLWKQQSATAESVRQALSRSRELKDSTVRTVLRRLEEKGYVSHEVEGRTYIYQPLDASHRVAADAVRSVIDRFCKGSVEQLLVGVVESEMLSPGELVRLAQKIADAEATEAGQSTAKSTRRKKGQRR